jgi:chromate reductase
MNPPKILAFAGSARSASWNKMLVKILAEGAREAGGDVTLIDLRDFPIPLYDGDDEAENGVPTKVRELRALISACDGLLLASPEYNGSVTPLLKNALDWCSRPVDGEDGLAPYRGKTVALASASLSPFGGIRSVSHLRGIFNKMGALVLADEVLVPAAHQAFGPDGNLTNDIVGKLARQLGAGLVQRLARVQP